MPWERCHRACPGAGATASPLLQLVGSALLCTLPEYASGLAMLHVMGIRTWDCRIPGWDFLASPDGLVCLRASLTFGVMGLVQLRGLNGLYRKLASKNPGGIGGRHLAACRSCGTGSP